ncbi:hypothetical protein EDC04DRAFT_2600380 [Pisolithus marmoratus]|nr:hypothetical protein EDC04DRAFT_2600380 [Pisolithus marmoratus]
MATHGKGMDADFSNTSHQSTPLEHQSTSEEATPSPMPPQDEIMCSPTATKPSTTPTVTPQAASPSAWSSMLTVDDVNMGSPMSDKSAPPWQLQPPLPSLLSVMQSHSRSTAQASQLPSTPTTTGTTPASHTNGLLHHAYLDSLNLAVNAEFHFLASQICQAGLAPGEVKHHLTKVHGTQSRYNDHQFNLAISAMNVATELPSHITGPRTMVHGLKVHDGVACSQCSFGSRPPSWNHCKIQQLRKGAGGVQTVWEVENVEAEAQPTLHQSLVDSLLKELEPMLQVIQTPLDGCMLVLQRLNSPDPMKSGISNTPFHKHLHKATMKHYILPVVALQAMLIKQEYSGKPFSGSNPKLMELLAVLCINDSQGRDALDLIHQLLFEVWTTAWTPQEDREIVDPTERCLALLTLKQDGSFKEPHEVTKPIAMFEYCMHLTFLKEIHHHLESDPDSNELEHLWWTDTRTWKSMLFRGEQVNFADICKVFEQTEAKLMQIWEEVILMGQDIRVEYDRIVDDLEYTASLAEDLCRASKPAAVAWPTQNLVVLGKHVSLLCQYLKTTELTGKDKLIPHALDGITSDILVQDLALARPFAEVAARACFPDKPEVVDLYQNHGFVNYD